ncbi:hypothetical protein JW905_13100 [bacterium]|nr:hypothetical protein [candidate division CSSED10-310 bacterium]
MSVWPVLHLIVLSPLFSLAVMLQPVMVRAEYFMYSSFTPGNAYITSVDAYVDNQGLLGSPGGQYLFLVGGSDAYQGNYKAYVYLVETDGDPDRHPDNPDNVGPIAIRTFM